MKKQTAVEWLIKKLQNREKGIFDGLPHLSLDEIYNQAKEMEKQQNALFYEKGVGYGICLASGIKESSPYPNYESVYNGFYETKE